MKHRQGMAFCFYLSWLVGASCAHAQSSVKIEGLLDVWAGQTRVKAANGTTRTANVLSSGGMQTPYIGFGGREDLGGGLYGVFQLDAFVRPDTGDAARSDTDPLWSRNAYVGLGTNRSGELVIGRASTPLIGALFATNPWLASSTFSASFANHWAGTVQGDTSFANSLRYVSPSFGPLRLMAHYSLGEERADGPDKQKGKSLDLRIDYAQGPWLALVALRTINLSNNEDGRKQQTLLVGGSYDFGPAKVYGQFMRVDDRYRNRLSNVDRNGFSTGVRVPVGQWALIAAYSRSTIDDDFATTPRVRNTWSIGGDYFLSKRTDLYIAYLKDTLREPQGVQTSRAGIGLRHRF